MNERPELNKKDTDICLSLAETFDFIAKENQKLGRLKKAKNRFSKAEYWQNKAEIITKGSGQPQNQF